MLLVSSARRRSSASSASFRPEGVRSFPQEFLSLYEIAELRHRDAARKKL